MEQVTENIKTMPMVQRLNVCCTEGFSCHYHYVRL